MNPRRYLAALLACHQLIFAYAALAQQRPSAAAAAVPGGIKILILEGQNAINSVRSATAVEPVLEVRDENDLPIEGATVTFQLPQTGPGGSFPGQKLTLEAKTNFRGQVGAVGFVPNNKEGAFQIHVTATDGARTAEAVISQTNSASTVSMGTSNPKKPFWRNKYVLIGGAAVVATTLVIVLTRGSSKNTTVTITPGPVTINQ